MTQGSTHGVPIDTDGTLSANSDQLVASQKATKTYVDTGAATKQPLDADLSAIAALASAADKLPYATGAQAWALTDLTSAARTVIDDTTVAAMRTTLGIPTAVGGVEWTVIVKASDESVSGSTVLQDDNELFVTPAAGVYEVELALVFASPAGAGTPDIKWALGEDNTARGAYTSWVLNATGSAAATLGAFALNSVPIGGTAAANSIALGKGSYNASGALFKLQWAQNTSDANATIVRAGSMLRYRRIA